MIILLQLLRDPDTLPPIFVVTFGDSSRIHSNRFNTQALALLSDFGRLQQLSQQLLRQMVHVMLRTSRSQISYASLSAATTMKRSLRAICVTMRPNESMPLKGAL